MSDDALIVAIEGRVGRLRLNRPGAIHALTADMGEAIRAALDAWRTDPAIEMVMIDHASGRGFCAGGDVRAAADSGRGDGVLARAFFRTEYRMNHALFTFAKPSVAFMDGITMGGGVGVALPCRYRVATENTKLAMPETAIGLFPDVGGGWYLSRLPGRIGQYLALTGHRLNGADCLTLGLATHYLPSTRLDEAKRALVESPAAEITSVLDALAETPDDATILDHRADIDRLFAADEVEGIYAALEADGGDWAAAQLATLRTRSPLSLKVSLKLLLDGATMPTFEDEMRQEYAVATRMVQRHDFAEGVRALLVDKDAPRWAPDTIEGVSDHVIDQIFAPLGDDEAWAP